MDSSQSPEGDVHQESTRRRVKKACTECRQQKARCDGYLDPEQPCSRCRKMAIHCVMSDPFKRENKRQRIAELEEETRSLRRKLETAGQESPGRGDYLNRQTSAFDILTAAAAGFGADLPSKRKNSSKVLPQMPTRGDFAALPAGQVSEPMADRNHHKILPESTSEDPTLPRSLDQISLTGKAIDELFHLYFCHFSQYIPILDSSVTPNSYYSQSVFLFWMIITVASRMYTSDPTLPHAIAPNVLDMAVMSIKTRAGALHSIRGLLLLLNWPISRGLRNEMFFPLVGALWHMAMHSGLHMPFSAEDPRVNLSEDEIRQRAELWTYCTITYQRSCSLMGQSPLILPRSKMHNQVHATVLSALKLHWRLHNISTLCCSALLENGLEEMSEDQERALDIILRIFEAQVKETEDELRTDIDRIYYDITLLTIQVFHFFKTPPANPQVPPSIPLIHHFTTSCRMIDHFKSFGQGSNPSPKTMPQYFRLALITAAVSLLRLVRGSHATYFDIERARHYVFIVIDLLKMMSIESEDSWRYATILTQLWNSEKAFKQPDGTPYTALRIRARLALSSVFDALWWWRDEFGVLPSREPAHDLRKDITSASTAQYYSNTAQPRTGNEQPPTIEPSAFSGLSPSHFPSHSTAQNPAMIPKNDPFFSELGFEPYDFGLDSAALFPFGLGELYEPISESFALETNTAGEV